MSRLIRLQVHSYRYRLTDIILPVRKYLQALAPAEKDDAVRRAIALYLAEKAKNGTPRQREIAEKILKRNPFFLSIASPPFRHHHALANAELDRYAELQN
jgi:hypothetical protein